MQDRRARLAGRMPWIVTGGTLLATAVVLLVPGWRAVVFAACGHLVALDFEALRDQLQQYGGSAWLISSLLMIVQSLAAPIPAVPITLANGLIYGPWLGALISWASAQVAALICFYLARSLGRPFVERLFSEGHVARWDTFFERYGLFSIVVARLIPLISFDVVSYASGVTRVRAVPFVLATGLGQLPATIAYSHAGAELADSPGRAVTIMLWFVGVVVLLAGLVWIRRRRREAASDG